MFGFQILVEYYQASLTLLILKLSLAIPTPWLQHLGINKERRLVIAPRVGYCFPTPTKAVFFDFFLAILRRQSDSSTQDQVRHKCQARVTSEMMSV